MGSTPNHWHSAPEVVPDTGLHVVRDDLPEPVHASSASTANINANQWPHHPEINYPEEPPPGGYFASHKKAHHPEKSGDLPEVVPPRAGPRKRICGLAPRLFWILIAVTAVVVLGAAVGVGVGVGLAVSNRSQSAESSSESPASTSTTSPTSLGVVSTSLSASISASASDAPTTTSAESTSVTTTDVVGPSSTLFRDCPSSDKTLHDVTLGNDTYVFRKFCSTVLVATGDNVVSTPTADLNSCINQCAKYNYNSASEIDSGENAVWYVILSLAFSLTPFIVCVSRFLPDCL